MCESGATWRERALLSRRPRSLPPSPPWWRSRRSWKPAETKPRRPSEGGSLGGPRAATTGTARPAPPPHLKGPFWEEKKEKKKKEGKKETLSGRLLLPEAGEHQGHSVRWTQSRSWATFGCCRARENPPPKPGQITFFFFFFWVFRLAELCRRA